MISICGGGGTGRRKGLKIPCPVRDVPVRFRPSAPNPNSYTGFWEYISFVINSLVFLLIGLEVHVSELIHAWRPVLFAIAAVLIGRAFSVYLLVPTSNFFAGRRAHGEGPVQWRSSFDWSGCRSDCGHHFLH